MAALFSKPKAPPAPVYVAPPPEPPAPEPPAPDPVVEEAAKKVVEETKKKRGLRATIATGPEGILESAPTLKKRMGE